MFLMISDVVGSGMLAKAFQKSDSRGCTFFCSGVSNSTETNPIEFEREAALLKKVLAFSKSNCLVYFSSILAPAKGNKYYEHKSNMEQLVKSQSNEYLILRLPQVAGNVLNNTLLPSFIKKIYFEEYFEVYSDAPRSLVDVDDVVKIFDKIYKDNIKNKTLNLCPGYFFQPVELTIIIGELLGKQPNMGIVKKESIQLCEPEPILSDYQYLLGDLDTYLKRVVNKYTKSIVEKLEFGINT